MENIYLSFMKAIDVQQGTKEDLYLSHTNARKKLCDHSQLFYATYRVFEISLSE